MDLIKSSKFALIAMVIAFTVSACGGGGASTSTSTTPEKVVGLTTADNTQLLNE